MNRLTADDRWWLAVLRAALEGVAPPEPEDAPDWSRIMQAARRHDLLPMTAAGIEHYHGFVPEKAAQALEKARNQALYAEATRDLELEQLFHRFSEEKIEFLPLKGTVLKRYYPSPELRTMGDVDLLIWPESFATVGEILRARGYSVDHETALHRVWSKPGLTLEQHRELFEPESNSLRGGLILPALHFFRSVPRLPAQNGTVFDRTTEKFEWNPFNGEFLAERLRERLRTVSDDSTQRQMAPDDFYLYQLLHLLEHFSASGAGVRFFLDMEVLRRQIGQDKADLPQIADERLRRYGLDQFASEIDRLSRRWFAPEKPDRCSEELEEFVFFGGTFGSTRQLAASRVGAFSSSAGPAAKLRLLLAKEFPARRALVHSYPKLARNRTLLPLCWLHLNFQRIFSSRRRVFLPYLKSVLLTRRSETEKITSFYRSIGLQPVIEADQESDNVIEKSCDKNITGLNDGLQKEISGEYQRILIVKLSSLGDILHTLPFVAALRRRFPDAQIDWAVHPAFSGLIPGVPWIDRVIPFRRPSFRCLFKTLRELVRLRKELHARRYDLAVDLQGLAKSALVVLLSGAKTRLGTGIMREGSALVSRRVVGEHITSHAVERSLDVARLLGAETERPEYPFPDLKEARESVLSKLREKLERSNKSDTDAPFVVFVPGTRWETKTWPAEYFASCAKCFIHERINVVLAGSAFDRPLADQIFHYLEYSDTHAADTFPAGGGSVVSLVGETSLAELAALIKNAQLFVGGDTGPLHIAAAAGTRLITIFGPTRPERTGPYGSANATILIADLDCIGCLKRHCSHKSCMKAITPEMVWSAFRGE